MFFQYKKLLPIFAVASMSTALFGDDSDNHVAPYLQHRASDIVNKVVGMNQHNHLFGLGSNYGTVDLSFRYKQSFRSKGISELLWGPALVSNTTTTSTTTRCDSDCDTDNTTCSDCVVKVTASNVTTKAATDLEAEQFILPTDYQSILSFKPRSQQFRAGIGFYMAFDEVCEGLFMRVRGDFVHTRHNLKFSENKTAGTATDTTLASFSEYASGKSLAVTTDGASFEGLKYAKFDCDSKTINEFGDLYLELGYNAWLDEDGHFGFSGLFIAPTGKKPKAEWLWEPIGTNGGHFGLGATITSHYTLWRSEDEEKHFDFVFDAEVTHLFGAEQTRTLDLRDKPLSRYALAKKMKPTGTDLRAGTTASATNAIPALQFADVYAPVANISTQKVKSSFGVQADLVGMFTFVCHGWSWDLGYNFFGMSSEKLSLKNEDSCDTSCSDSTVTTFAENTWALAGTSASGTPQSYGFNGTTKVNLSTTLSGSTVFKSSAIDSSTNAWAGNGTTALTTTATSTTQVTTSLTPVAIKVTDLDIEGAETRVISHSLFTHINYTWVDREDWVPFVGFGAQVEFGHNGNCGESCNTVTTTTTTNTSCDDSSSSRNTALSQWGIWIKGGVSFN